jgi:hypothetical protein
MTLFKSGFVYPNDQYGGEYEDLDGIIRSVRLITDSYAVDVETPEGKFTGYWPKLISPKISYMATIRVYRCGGGWYPDNRIIHWGMPEFFTAAPLATVEEKHGTSQKGQTQE